MTARSRITVGSRTSLVWWRATKHGPSRWPRVLVGIGLAWILAAPVTAQEAARIPIIDAEPGTPALGAGVRLGSNPYTDAREGLDLVPLYLFEGRWLYSHGTSGGVHIYRNKRISLDAFVRYRFLNLDPDDDDSLDRLTKREQTVDAGLSFGVRGKWGDVKANWLADVLDRHSGEEVELSYRYRFDRGRWIFSPYVQLEWWDAELTNYYFGVNANEVTPDRSVYSPGTAVNLEYGLNTSYRATSTVHIFANVAFKEWDRKIHESPIVNEAITTAAFIGATYTFGSAYGPAKGAPTQRETEWSWRVNYGYQAEGNIVGEIDQGDFSKSTRIDTNIAGFTYGRLLSQGPRIDYYGRLAVYRHLEKPFQDNFNSYAAYIMAMGKGFLRWREQPFFRWGFGFGFNYAAEVPGAEQIKQGSRDRETNKFLNYLEMQLDFAIDAMTGDRSWIFGNCYIGSTLVHRSGMFATSDLLGNVAGGADWITLHLECLR